MEEKMQANASRPLFTGVAVSNYSIGILVEAYARTKHAAAEILPHVYTSHSIVGTGGGVLSQFGSKYMLPLGTTRHLHEVSFRLCHVLKVYSCR